MLWYSLKSHEVHFYTHVMETYLLIKLSIDNLQYMALRSAKIRNHSAVLRNDMAESPHAHMLYVLRFCKFINNCVFKNNELLHIFLNCVHVKDCLQLHYIIQDIVS